MSRSLFLGLRAPLLFVVVLIASCAASFGASSPLTWRWSNPRPHGNNIIDMAFSGGLLVQVAERGQVYTTGDLATWTPRDSHTTAALRSVTFFKSNIIATGESGTVVLGETASNLRFISIGTADWLEGVAASTNLAVAVGDNAAIYTSSDGVNWNRQSPPFNNWLRSVCFGTPSGVGTFVAVGEDGLIATSQNGVAWQKRVFPSGNLQHLNKVAWHTSQFVAAGNNGTTLASNDGVSWQFVATGATNALNGLTGTNSSRLVVGDNELRLFEGRSWSNELDPAKPAPAPAWTYLSAVWDGTSYLVGGRTGMFIEGFKTNATSGPTFWAPISDSLRNWLWDVKRFSGVYLAVGDRATIMSSLDGIDWQQELPPESAASAVFLGVGGKTNFAVAVGSAGTIIYSPDEKRNVVSTNAAGTVTTNQVSTLGIVWNSVAPRPVVEDLQGVAAFGNLLVVSGGNGTILTSPNGTNWTRQSTPTTSFLSSIASFPGGVVAVGKNGAILSSPDAVRWTPRSSNTTNWIYRIRFLGNRLVAVGQNGVVLTSTNGTNWIVRSSGTSRWLNDVEWIDNTYFAIGTQGAFLTSPDAVDWADIGTITQKSLYGAATESGQLVVAGIEGVILRSQVTPIITPVRFVDFPHNASQNLFLFSGRPDQRFTLDKSTNLNNWDIGPQLEISDSSGTLLYLDNRTNAPLIQFYRAMLKP